jgi:YHS domain-containing protein
MQRRILAGLLAVWFVTTVIAFAAKAATTERIVNDPRSGLALYGFDAVAYFIDGAARAGSGTHEFRYSGLTWRFRSEANLAAFTNAPQRYVPEFGGYDPTAVAAGMPVEGNPAFFAVSGGKLFLFAREESLARFLANPAGTISAAQATWPDVVRKLVP